jgi:hypothetical protein
MTRALLFVAISLGLLAPLTADATSRHKHRRQGASSAAVHQPRVHRPRQAPAELQRRGPPWAMPNECYNDEGYGRWTPCVERPD